MMVNLRQLIFYGEMVGINISKSMPTRDRTLLLQDTSLLYTKRALRLSLSLTTAWKSYGRSAATRTTTTTTTKTRPSRPLLGSRRLTPSCGINREDREREEELLANRPKTYREHFTECCCCTALANKSREKTTTLKRKWNGCKNKERINK